MKHARVVAVAAVMALCQMLTAAPAAATALAAKPRVARAGAGASIEFALTAPGDVEVAILAADGGVVRHLAAGVLGGASAPPAPLKPGLNQALAWDGRDDFGAPAGGGPFKVRVRAGAGVKPGRMIGEDPYSFGFIDSLATDEEGNLYVTATASDCNQSAQFLRVFTPEGRYLRTLIPFAADLPPERVEKLATWDADRKLFVTKNHSSGNPSLYPVNGLQLVSAARQAGIVMLAGTTICRMDADGGNFSGPAPMWSPAAKLKNPAWNKPKLATSPDGKYIYYSNVAGTLYQPKAFKDTDPNWPQGRVYRQAADGSAGDPQKFYDLELPDWEQQKYWLPDAWNKRTAAYGIATDAKGHLYICDLVNQEVVEVSPEGKKLSASKAPWPEQVLVNNANGDLYVVCRLDRPKDGRVGKKLVKLSGRGAAARIVAEMALADGVGEAAAVGKSGGEAVLWLGGGRTLLCVADRGAAFETVATEFKPRAQGQLDWGRIVVDAGREEFYANNGVSLTYRYNGLTGEGGLLKKNGQTFWCVDMSVGYDGSLYMRTGNSFTGPLERYTHDLEPLPFPTGTHQLWDIYSRYGIGFCDKGVAAGPRGESYISYMYDWNQYFVAGFGADGKPIQGRYLKGLMKKPDPKSWVAKLEEGRQVTSAVVGPIPASSGGIAVDLAGNLYVGMLLVPKGFQPPSGFAKDPAFDNWTGSIVKFPPSGGTVLGAVKKDDPADAEGPRTACEKGLTVVGATALYPGLAPFSGGGYGGNSSCCVCRVPRFQVDRYGRIVFTSVVTQTATLIDNAGNKILEFGGYGNFDSQFVNPVLPAGKSGKPTVAVPDFPLAWPAGAGMSDNHIYVIDTYNKRVLRADLTFKSEEVAAIL